jgi:zinc transport system substrate-binding protein
MTQRILSAIASAALLAACNQSPESKSAPQAQSAAPAKPKPSVVASFYPLYEFTRHVAGDAAEVTSLVPPGVEPHDWEPAPQDVARLEKARVFVYNGAGFEPWADKLLANIGGKGPVVVVATQGIELLRADLPGHGHEHDHGKSAPAKKTAKETATEQDPHVWLDPVLAQKQVESIRMALAQADPDNAAHYAAQAKAFSERLAAVGDHYERGLAQCARREIVVSHASFSYPAKRYRLTQVPVMGLSPNSEPSPAQLAQIIRFARRHKVKFIFFETLVSPKLAETLAREVGAQTLVLNPIEGLGQDDQAAGKGYVDLMEENLENLRTALGCT